MRARGGATRVWHACRPDRAFGTGISTGVVSDASGREPVKGLVADRIRTSLDKVVRSGPGCQDVRRAEVSRSRARRARSGSASGPHRLAG